MVSTENAILTRIPDPTIAKQITFHTSSYDRAKTMGWLPYAVSISLSDKYPVPNRYTALNPSRDLLNAYKYRGLSWGGYVVRYNQELSQLDPQTVLADLRKFAGPDGRVIMLCWERENTQCHRRLAAEWLTRMTGVPVTEI